LGSNLLIVAPGSTTSSSGVRGGFGSVSTLTVADATALTSKIVAPDIAAVAPTAQRSESLTAGTSNWTSTVVGTMPNWLTVRARTVASGRFLTSQDAADHAAVVVLAATTAQELFGPRAATGQTVTIGHVPLTVVGVLGTAGSTTVANEDDQALVPLPPHPNASSAARPATQCKPFIYRRSRRIPCPPPTRRPSPNCPTCITC
jgi:putative ABC transport system permease protein